MALHSKSAPIAALCHGPALLLSAPERADGQWLFDGYRLTCFTDEEEVQTEAGLLGMSWFLDTALKNAGAVFDDSPAAWVSHVVADRNLITGQNPRINRGDRGRGHQGPACPGPRRRLSIEELSLMTSIQTETETETVPGSAPASGPAATVQAFLEALARRDAAAALAVVDPQAAVTIHPLGVRGTGRDALRTVLDDLIRAFPTCW